MLAFLRDMAKKAKPFAEKDMAELLAFAKDELGITDFQPWDAAWVSEKLQQARYAFSAQEVKAYFTEPKVVAGLFKVIESLFTVTSRRKTRRRSGTRTCASTASKHRAGELVGQFYMDLYARETKRGGAWMDEARSRKRTAGGIQKPIAYLNCNFARPVGGKPATFTHDEVITLFHEAGHGLHHLLTRGEELGVPASTASNGMRSNCPRSSWKLLLGMGSPAGMTAHVDTGEPLPRALRQDAGRQELPERHDDGAPARILDFDMRLHCEFDPNGEQSVMDLIREVRRKSPC